MRKIRQDGRALAVTLFCGLCLLVLLMSRAVAGPVLVLTEHFQRSHLTEYFEYLEDAESAYSLEDILSPALRDRFIPGDRQLENIGYTPATWWLRLTVQNPGQLRELMLSLERASLGDITLYSPDEYGHYQARRAGVNSQRIIGDIAHHNYWFQLAAWPESKNVYYLRLRSPLSLSTQASLGTPAAMAVANDASSNWFGIGVGVLLGLALYNLLLLRHARSDYSHLYYVIFLASTALHLLAERGTLGVAYWPVPGLQHFLQVGSIYLCQAAGTLFTLGFLGLQARAPQLDRLLRLQLLILLLLLALHFFLPASISSRLASLLGLPTTLLLIVASAYSFRTGYRPALYLLLGNLVLVVAVLLANLNVFGLLGLGSIQPSILIMAATGLQAVLLAIGLTARLQLGYSEAAQAREAAAVSQAESRAKGSFLAQVSHEIRTPMSGILGMTELLLDTPLTPNQREYANTIHTSSNSLLRILNDILDYSKMEAGKLSVVEEDFDLSELINDCLDLFKAHAEGKQLELIANIDARVPNLVTGDPTRLRQVISNLLRNAIKFTQTGEVIISISPDTVQGGTGIRVEVTDTGIGIPATQLAAIFDPYQQGSNNTRPETGTGLGLSICKQLVELMGGQIGVASTERKGSTFWFDLPLKAQRGESKEPAAFEGKLKGLRLLIVDDNHTVNRVIQQQALGWGLTVSTADNGAEALAMARNAANLGEPFDIIILDHNMPGMSGLQLAARIKEDPLIKNDVVVMMLTGINIAPTSTMARNVGIRRVLTKPVTERQLKAAIAEELGHIERLRKQSPVHAETELLKSMRVLIAEDNHLSQKVIRGMLGKLGVNATVVANGKEVVEEVSRNDYDLVLMDCDMPFMDGYVATQAIREWERSTGRSPIPILALTAHILDEHKNKSRLSGMDEHLSKPLELAELQEALLRWSTRQK